MKRPLLLMICVFFLTACGGGDSPPAPTPPPAPIFHPITSDGEGFFSTSTKKLFMNWSAVSGATAYQLFEDNGTGTTSTQVGINIPAPITSTELPNIEVDTYGWQKTKYTVKACASGLCSVFSNEQTALSAMVSAIPYIKASDTNAKHSFGASIALSGDGNTLAIGASGEDSETTTITGAVYLFTKVGTTWAQQQVPLKASNAEAGDQFGHAVSLSHDGLTLAVGAIGESSATTTINGDQADNTATASGAVYLFSRTATTTWAQHTYLKASNADEDDRFGHAISLSRDGNTLAIGATGESSTTTTINGDQSDNGASNAGAVYLFTKVETTWTQQAYLKASNAEEGDFFGGAVSLNGDGHTLAVGAANEASAYSGINSTGQSSDGASNAGAVYLFVRSGTTWSQQAYIKASNPDAEDQFGNSLSLSANGNTLAVGATGEDSAASGTRNGANTDGQASDLADDAGAVYIFARAGVDWSQQSYIKASNPATQTVTDTGVEYIGGGALGSSVSLSVDGNTLAVGATGEKSNAVAIGGNQENDESDGSGAVYLFNRSADATWSQKAYIKASNTELDAGEAPGQADSFGVSVSLSGDGKMLAVGANGEDSNALGINGDIMNNGAIDSGAVYLY
ncbi:MAG: integrin [Nitrospirota bacterium]